MRVRSPAGTVGRLQDFLIGADRGVHLNLIGETMSNITSEENEGEEETARNTSVGEVEEKTTCGPLFNQCLTQIHDAWLGSCFPTDSSGLIVAGHALGQAEKIHLGACSAAMFRPSTPILRGWILQVCAILSGVYSLEISVFEREEIADEIWIHTPESRHLISRLAHIEYNSQEWHTLRGKLCGVPPSQIDCEFHLRKGFGEPCDTVSAQTPIG